MEDQLLNSLTSSTQSASDTQDQLRTLLESIQPQLQLFLTLGIIMSVVIFIGLLINSIYKIRVERAILRIDRNIQKLVDYQVPAKKAPIEVSAEADEPADFTSF